MSRGFPVRKALVVDDNVSVAELAKRLLLDLGYEVVAADNFSEARELLATQTFDLLLLDIRLREFNGLQLAIEARSARADARIVVMSGFDDVALRQEVSACQATFLKKPFTQADLKAAVESAVG
jgi:CheY-like chemotaxis protein